LSNASLLSTTKFVDIAISAFAISTIPGQGSLRRAMLLCNQISARDRQRVAMRGRPVQLRPEGIAA
jgi:hypothetical protein